MNTYVVTATNKSLLVLAVSVAHEHGAGVDGNIIDGQITILNVIFTDIRYCQE